MQRFRHCSPTTRLHAANKLLQERGKSVLVARFARCPFAKTPCCVERPLVMSQGALTPAVASVLSPEVPQQSISVAGEFLQQAANKGLITLFSCDHVRDLQTLFYPLDSFQSRCLCVYDKQKQKNRAQFCIYFVCSLMCIFFLSLCQ